MFRVPEVLPVRCECGEPTCEETVSLSVVVLEELRRTERAVLAPGHPLDRARDARQRSAEPREEAKALHTQVTHQRRRAERARAEQELRQARVLVVDDSAVFLHAARSLVSAAGQLRLAGSAASGREALRLLPQLKPDLVLLDIHMPGLDGIETARVIHRHDPKILIVLISLEPEGFTDSARSAGAVALLDKADLRPATLDALWLKHRPGGG